MRHAFRLPTPTLPGLTLAGLMLTQTLGWGSSISLIGVLAEPIRADLGISSALIYGGTSVMFVTGAVLSPWAGRQSDRLGGLRLLCYGAPVLALALIVLALSQGLVGYLAAWFLFGIGMHMGLATAAYNGLAGVSRQDAYRNLGILTLATGLNSTLFWPLTEWMLTLMDWRAVCMVFAAMTLLIALPIHLALAHAVSRPEVAEEVPVPPSPAHVAPARRDRAFRLIMLMQLFSISLGTAISILVIDMLVSLGTERVTAVLSGSLIGVSYLVSRVAILLIGERIGRMALARIVYVALPLTFLPLLVFAVLGLPLPAWLAVSFGLVYGLPAGLLGVLRPALPFHVFGSSNYGQRLGRLTRPTDLATAVAPAAIGGLMSVSPTIMLLAVIFVSVLSCISVFALSRLVEEGDTHRHYESE